MDIGRRMKKKSVEHMIFSTMALMNTITNDIEISSPLRGAINEEDLGKIRKVLVNLTQDLSIIFNII